MTRSIFARTMLAVAASISLVRCGSDSTNPAGPTTTTNRPPTATATVSPAGVPIASATVVTFTASGSDPDGQPVSFSWQFGDGATASGATVSHTFATAGSYNVVLTASDGQGGSVTVGTAVTVKSMTGSWVDEDPRLSFQFTQSGSNLSGERDAAGGSGFLGYGSLAGNVSNARAIVFTITYRAQGVTSNCRYEGTIDDQGDSFRVQRTNDGFWCGQESYSARRQ